MKIQITNGMFVCMIMTMVYAKAIGLTQGIMARQAGGDIWMATIFSIGKGMLLMLLTVWLIRRLPDKNIIEHAEFLLGKWVGKLTGIVIFVFFTGAFATMMITYVYHIMDYFLPEAPIILFVAIAGLVTIYGLYQGFEVAGRLALISVFSMITFNILMIAGSMNTFEIRELLPVFQTGALNTFYVSRHHDTDWAMATMMAALILPYIREKEVWSKSGPIGILYGGMIVLLWPILEVAVLSPEVTAQYIVACMQMARSVEIGLFIHRYEMIMVAMFAIPLFLQSMLCVFCASVALSHTFGMKDFRPLIIPVTLLLGAFGYWVVFDHIRAMDLLTYYWPPLALPIAVGLPLVLLVIGFFFRRKIRQAGGNEK